MLTEQEKSSARGHLGYLQVQQAQTFVLGIPAAVQTQFMIEGAFTRVLPSAEARFRQLLVILDGVLQQIVDNQIDLAVEAIDEIKINLKEFKHLVDRYEWWRRELANLMGILPNPFDQRFQGWGGAGYINTSVAHG
jgi:hypothetical protein